jgi:hypothetical protein
MTLCRASPLASGSLPTNSCHLCLEGTQRAEVNAKLAEAYFSWVELRLDYPSQDTVRRCEEIYAQLLEQ